MILSWEAIEAGAALRAAAFGGGEAPGLAALALGLLALPALFALTGWLWRVVDEAGEGRGEAPETLLSIPPRALWLSAAVTGAVALLFGVVGLWVALALHPASAAGLALATGAFALFSARCAVLARVAARSRRRAAAPQRSTSTRP